MSCVALVSLALLAQVAEPPVRTKDDVHRFLIPWPAPAKHAALEMLRKYGVPDDVTDASLTWHDPGPWSRITVYRRPAPHAFPAPHADVLEQVVPLAVPVDKIAALARFNGSVVVDRTRGEVAVRCDSEAANIAVLNLARQILDGRLTPTQARARQARLWRELAAGRIPTSARALLFEPERAPDPDRPAAAVPTAGR